MKNTILLIFTTILLSGCYEAMTNDEVITEKDKCVKAGMDYEVIIRGEIGKPYAVNCIKPKQVIQPL